MVSKEKAPITNSISCWVKSSLDLLSANVIDITKMKRYTESGHPCPMPDYWKRRSDLLSTPLTQPSMGIYCPYFELMTSPHIRNSPSWFNRRCSLYINWFVRMVGSLLISSHLCFLQLAKVASTWFGWKKIGGAKEHPTKLFGATKKRRRAWKDI